MTQPPLKLSRRWIVFGGVALLAIGGAYVIQRHQNPGPALLPTIGPVEPNFNHSGFSPSELVSNEELCGPLRREGFADAIGLGRGVASSTVKTLPNLDVKEEPPDGPHGQRRVTDGKWEIVFWDYCGQSQVCVVDEKDKPRAELVVKGHAHSTGVVAPQRGILAATCADPDVNKQTDRMKESHVVIFDYRNDRELGVLTMPLANFKTLAISRDERWLYIGFGDGSVRRFNLDSAKPRPKSGVTGAGARSLNEALGELERFEE